MLAAADEFKIVQTPEVRNETGYRALAKPSGPQFLATQRMVITP